MWLFKFVEIFEVFELSCCFVVVGYLKYSYAYEPFFYDSGVLVSFRAPRKSTEGRNTTKKCSKLPVTRAAKRRNNGAIEIAPTETVERGTGYRRKEKTHWYGSCKLDLLLLTLMTGV